MPKTIFDGAHTKLVETLVDARKRSGLTQAQLASKIGKDQTYISLIERGQRRVDVLEFVALSRAMNDDPEKLFAKILEKLPLKYQI